MNAYYGIALKSESPERYGVLLITKEPRKPVSQEWTGEEFTRKEDAEAAMVAKNEALFGKAVY